MRVFNITGLPGSGRDPVAFPIAGQLVRPGRSIEVNAAALSETEKKMHGSSIWLGDTLPASYRKPAPAPSTGTLPPMTLPEVTSYLLGQSPEALVHLAEQLSPPLQFSGAVPHPVLASRLARLLMDGSRIQDPEPFLWLRRWVRVGNRYSSR